VGITDEHIKALAFYKDSPLFDAKEKATILHAERLTRGPAAIRESTLEQLRPYFSEDQIVELTLVVCVANFTNRFNDGLQIEADIG